MQALAVSFDWSEQDLQHLRQIACRLSRPGGDPDDLLQDALEKALKNFDRFQVGTNFTAWIRTIMQRLVIDGWRRRGRRRDVEPQDQHLVASEPEDEPPWAEFDLEDVRQAVAQLREPIRTTFRLSLDGLPYAEIATRQGIPLATVGTRLRRGRLQLKRLLFQMRSSDRHQTPWFSQPHPRASSPSLRRTDLVARPSWLPPLRAAIGATSSPS